jgi:TRAP-type mannitol/chloroaromatic compound transport system substrate-binding protein
MKRREFVRKASLGAVAGSTLTTATLVGCGSSPDSGGAAAVQTRPRVSWQLVSSFPRSLDTIYGAAEVLSERVSALTDGRFTIRSFPAGELVPYNQVLESVQKGTVAMGHSASYYYIGLNPALAFDCTVPFGQTVRQYNAWMYHGNGQTLTRELFADFNVLNFPGGNTGTQMGGWFRDEIHGLGDLNGIKMRIPGLGGKVMDAMGVNVQVLAAGEIYTALERGALDATEWSGPYDDEKLGFYKVARNYYYPGWWEPAPGLSFYINRDEWAKLPSDYQAALAAAAAEANVDMLAEYDLKNPAALETLLADGVNLQPFPNDVMLEAESVSKDMMATAAAADPAYRKVFEDYTSWQKRSNQWMRTAEQTYASFAFRNG